MQIITPEIEQYIASLPLERPEQFHQMEKRAQETHFPIVGPQVGVLLRLLAQLSEARQVFELGSGYGYSAAWFLLGMQPGGRIVLTDRSEANLEDAARTLKQLRDDIEIDCRLGSALTYFENHSEKLDIVFCDIEKKDYPTVIELARSRLRHGGLLISDNALWHGKVCDTDPDDVTQSLLEYNNRLATDPDFEAMILPVRDGLSIARRC